MSGWSDLASLGVTVRPLAEPKPPAHGRPCPFSASLTSTVELLHVELAALNATSVVLELDVRDRDIRVDGLPRANASPDHPGVGLSFESQFGPLRYATAEYGGRYWSGITPWQANLRAIALSMQALRAVDRYGVSKRGEQYQGWRQLPRSTDPADQIVTRDQALELLGKWMEPGVDDVASALKKALKATHPDRGGDTDDFRRVMRAKEILGL